MTTALTQFVVRLVTSDDAVHEFEFDDGQMRAERFERSQSDYPTLEIHVPRVDADLKDPRLHDQVFVVSETADGEQLDRLFPLCLGGASFPSGYIPDLAILWLLHNGPFGTFAWRNRFVDGHCEENRAVSVEDTVGTKWDVIVEVDYSDCVRFFLGEIEIRDVLTRGRIQGSISGLSALNWFVERPEMTERARHYEAQAQLLAAWRTAARADSASS